MIILNSKKTPEQTLELLKEHTLIIKKRNFWRFTFLWELQGDVLAGKIKNNNFCLILLNKHMAGFPLRFFYGKVIDADNRAVIEGKFKFRPDFWLNYLIVCIAVIFMGFNFDIWWFIASLVFTTTISILISLLKARISKDNEDATIERIKEIIAE